jgi:mycoredoxin
MEISYELTEDDLREVQAQLLVRRREEMRQSTRVLVLFLLGSGVLCWPLWRSMMGNNLLLSETALGVVAYLLMLSVVGAVSYALRSRPVARNPQLDAWMARRMARQAARQSVFGPITVTLGEEGVVRKNSEGELRMAWSEVRDILRSPRLLTLRLQRQQRVILVPTRAFPDEANATAFRERLEALAGRKSVDVDPEATVPRPPLREWARQERLPLLLAALGFAGILLIIERGPVWYYDPRPGNPPGRVIVYSTNWCPVCERLRLCLRNHRVPFEERDVEGSALAEAEWTALGGLGVPLTLVGQRVAHGMRQEQLQGALAEAGYSVDCWKDEPSSPPSAR